MRCGCKGWVKLVRSSCECVRRSHNRIDMQSEARGVPDCGGGAGRRAGGAHHCTDHYGHSHQVAARWVASQPVGMPVAALMLLAGLHSSTLLLATPAAMLHGHLYNPIALSLCCTTADPPATSSCQPAAQA